MLPRAQYLIRLVNGRVETQGTVEDLRASGTLSSITSLDRESEGLTSAGTAHGAGLDHADKAAVSVSTRRPRVLVEEERRAIGRIKWPIYKTYLKASYSTPSLLHVVCVAH